MHSGQRAYVFVDAAQISPIVGTGSVTVGIGLKNTGNTPAVNVSIRWSWAVGRFVLDAPTTPSSDADTLPLIGPLPPQQTTTSFFISVKNPTPEFIEQTREKKLSLYLVVHVAYNDVFSDTVRTVDTCLIYRMDDSRLFNPCGTRLR